jgi:glycosyltransferase involved in cell wall biosynthesis
MMIQAHLEKNEGGLRVLGTVKNSLHNQPLVTVITVVLNGALHLEQTICSVLGQGYDNLEYLVLDGGSTDGSLEIIKGYEKQIDYWRSEPDSGIYDAMNKGLALAKGELIVLVNADDYFEPGAVEKVVTTYREADRDTIIYGHTRILQEDLGLSYIMTAHENHWKGMGFTHSAMFVPRTVYQRLGGYNCRYTLAADYDFLLQALREGIPIRLVDAVLNNYRNTGLSASNLARVLGEMRIINRKHFSTLSLSHIKFLLLRYTKSMLLIWLQKLVGLCGPGPILAVKRFYTNIFFARK